VTEQAALDENSPKYPDTGTPQLQVEPDVLWEDENLLAVNKPSGLVTHPTYKHPNGTLTDVVFARQQVRGEGRPWLLHRLDRDTSGVVLFAKTEQARRALVRQFEQRTIRKQYLAVVAGQLDPPQGTIDAPLCRDPLDRRRVIVDPVGQAASTDYRTLATGDEYALVLAQPRTGRTHQIRAHFASLGAPLLGDSTYLPEGHGAMGLAARSMLHAWHLDFRYPATQRHIRLGAPIPDDMRALLRQLGFDAPETLQFADDTFEEAIGGTYSA
jgi:23S rRNA pseudouridine1911/1915/1917 synthase